MRRFLLAFISAWLFSAVSAQSNPSHNFEPIVNFTQDKIFSCDGSSTIQFTNESVYATSYHWDFGDGSTSNELNPSHTYTETGLFDVKLIAYGNPQCACSDSLVKANLIRITDDGPLVPVFCQPSTTMWNNQHGIKLVSFGGIHNYSGPDTEGYSDFTCNTLGQVTAGTFAPLEVRNYGFEESIEMWIDYNNDGDFSTDELVYDFSDISRNYSGEILISENAVVNTPLRFRVRSGAMAQGYPCNDLPYGQVEDYRLIILENNLAPSAAFSTSNRYPNLSEIIQFSDTSMNSPQSRQWFFEGGSPSTSTLQNPSVYYSDFGLYDVTLIVSNDNGSDTLFMPDYIKVLPKFNMCNQVTVDDIRGQLYDSGGPEGGYYYNENCSILIAPDCAQSITLTFQSLNIQYYWDNLSIYDGSDASAPLLFNSTNNTFLFDITSHSGEMFITFTSDNGSNRSGWSAIWEAVVATEAPEVDFEPSDFTPPLNSAVVFNDFSTGFPSAYEWDFGDGQISELKNPEHIFSTPGAYEVSLVASNCFGSDSISYEINVQQAAEMTVFPEDTLKMTINCEGQAAGILSFYNSGNGDLMVNTAGNVGAAGGEIRMLVHRSEFEDNTEIVSNVIATMEAYNIDVVYSIETTIDSDELIANLQDIDILLVTGDLFYYTYIFRSVSDALSEFLSGGGEIIFCGNSGLVYTGLFDSYSSGGDDVDNINLIPSHPLMKGITANFESEDIMALYENIYGEDIVEIASSATENEQLTVFEKNVDQGKLLYIAYTYNDLNVSNMRILANGIQYLSDFIKPSWLSVPTISKINTVSPGNSLDLDVMFDASDMTVGNYYHTFYLNTNSTGLDSIPYTFHMEVVGNPELTLSANELSLDPVTSSQTSHDTLIVYNEGCELLSVNASIASDSFIVQPESLEISPYTQDTLFISFSGDALGNYSNELLLNSNDGNRTILLTSSVLGPSSFDVMPIDTLNALADCGTSTTEIFTIVNSGSSNLEVDLKNVLGGIPKVLIFNTYAFEAKVTNMLNAISTYFTNYSISYSDADNSTVFEADLEGVDILIIPDQGFPTQSLFSSLSDALIGFAEAGGQIIMCSNLNVPATGLFSTSYSHELTINYLLENVASGHPIMEGIQNGPFATPDNSIAYNWESDPTIYPLCKTISGVDDYVVAYKNYGPKAAVYIGFDYADVVPQADRILANTMLYLAEKSHPVWIDNISNQASVTIPPGESLDVTIDFNAENLQAGDYYLDGFITTNDPIKDTLNYTIHFEVAGAAILELSENEMNFDPILVGLASADTIYLNNPGCDTLTVTGSNLDPNFSFTPESLSIPPFSQDTLFVFFAPEEVGVFASQLDLSTNGNDEIISLTGEGLTTPALALSPDTVYIDVVDCADSISVDFEIQNQGGGALVYNVAYEGWKPELPEVLSNLNENHTNLTSLVSNLFYFQGGDTGSSISGTDVAMYVDGNQLMPNSHYEHRAPYTNSEIHYNTYFGNGSSYFTAKYDGLFVLAADLNTLDNFLISGNEGYSSGSTQGFEYNYVDSAGISYTCFATRTLVGNGQANTVNHLVIMRSNMALNHTYSSNNQYENHKISGLTQTDRMYYLLFSTEAGTQVSTAEIQGLFENFVNTIIGVKANGTNLSGTVNPGETSSVSVTLSTAGREAGTHHIPILVLTNDPSHLTDTVQAIITVPENSCAAFSHYAEMDCSGHQYFMDKSLKNPTSWTWDFGDGATSTEQNPLHAYDQNGNYEVSLEVCNSIDCNTISQTIQVSNVDGLPLICTPTTATDQSEYYISKVTLNSTTHTSIGSASGYQDFTCKTPFEVTAGDEYYLAIFLSTNTNYHLRTWVDFNNDGTFDESELLYSYSSVFFVANIGLSVPIDAVVGEPLRFRIVADSLTHDPCDSLALGEVEDYAVIISAPHEAPEADFESHATDPCAGEFSFTDLSTHSPNSWLWSFGDGNTSTDQNPDHTYTSSGDYTVQLTATNTIGSNSYSESVHMDPFGFSELTASADPVINQPVVFNAPGDGVTLWHWDFGDGVAPIGSSPTISHSYSQPGNYHVTVNSGLSYCAFQRSLIIEVTNPVGIEDGVRNSEIRVSPNPSKGKIWIELPENMEVERINLFNSLGQMVYIETNLIHQNEMVLEVASAASGVYILVIRAKDGRLFRNKVVLE